MFLVEELAAAFDSQKPGLVAAILSEHAALVASRDAARGDAVMWESVAEDARAERDAAFAQLRAATDIIVQVEKIVPGVTQTAGRFAIGDVAEARAERDAALARVAELTRELDEEQERSERLEAASDQMLHEAVVRGREADDARKWANTMEHERDWERDVVQSELRAELEAARQALEIAEANRDQWHSAANESGETLEAAEEAASGLFECWDDSEDSLGPEWVGLGQHIDKLRAALAVVPLPDEREDENG